MMGRAEQRRHTDDHRGRRAYDASHKLESRETFGHGEFLAWVQNEEALRKVPPCKRGGKLVALEIKQREGRGQCEKRNRCV